jgi:hypothetical protein
MSTRVSWKCNRSERLSVIYSSSSYSSSYSLGCSSYSASLCGSNAISCSATISRMSIGSASSAGSSCGCSCGAGSGAALGMWDRLWHHWMGLKYGLSVIGPSAGVPLIPIFLRMCVMRKGKGNPHVFVCFGPRWCTPLQNFWI